jgi:hypothetical protein
MSVVQSARLSKIGITQGEAVNTNKAISKFTRLNQTNRLAVLNALESVSLWYSTFPRTVQIREQLQRLRGKLGEVHTQVNIKDSSSTVRNMQYVRNFDLQKGGNRRRLTEAERNAFKQILTGGGRHDVIFNNSGRQGRMYKEGGYLYVSYNRGKPQRINMNAAKEGV